MAEMLQRYYASQSEREFHESVVMLAKRFGWRVYHTYDARRSEWGWPDLVLVRPPDLLLIELKREIGRLTRAQEEWLGLLVACKRLRVGVWRPSQIEEITRILMGEE